MNMYMDWQPLFRKKEPFACPFRNNDGTLLQIPTIQTDHSFNKFLRVKQV